MRTSAVRVEAETVRVDDLRVGMFIHLDLGWMAHPFPLGSFRIASEDQIATIRTLGLERLRWSPAESDPVLVGGSLLPIERRDAPHADPLEDDDDDGLPAPASRHAALEPPAVALARPATPAAAGVQRRVLQAQRTAQQRCERRFEDAARDLRELTGRVIARPEDARAGAERLSSSLVEQTAGDRELCIRLLTEAAGDRASAHALNVTVISLLMGRTFGMSPDELGELAVGALMHDVGKLEVPERARHLDEPASTADRLDYESHVAHGVAHARRMGLSAHATLVIAEHHEHADGSGFPRRLHGDRMSVAGRIVALANRYDNLCNPRHPAQTLTPHEALSLLFSQGHARFDTAVLNGFIRMMGVYPAGSAVQLTDDRYALVVGTNATRPLKPRVIVHEARVPRDEALVLDLERASGLGIRRSVRPAALPDAVLQYLSPRPRVAYFFDAASVDSDVAAFA